MTLSKHLHVLLFRGFILLLPLFFSCRHEPVIIDDDPPVELATCHPDTIYFERDILPVLISTCAISGCHDAITQQDGVRLTDYQSVMETADVRPGRPDNSDLYERITDDDLDDRMPPPPYNPLTDIQIQNIFTWINQGAQNLFCQADCDTLNVTYSATIVPVLNTYCINCHSGNNPSGGINLGSYQGVSVVASDGRLGGAVQHQPGYVPMPLGGAMLNDCALAQVMIWINDGFPEN